MFFLRLFLAVRVERVRLVFTQRIARYDKKCLLCVCWEKEFESAFRLRRNVTIGSLAFLVNCYKTICVTISFVVTYKLYLYIYSSFLLCSSR